MVSRMMPAFKPPGVRALDEPERLVWLQLSRSENVGPVTFSALLQRYGAAGPALDALPELARRGGRKKPIKVCPRADADAEVAATRAAGARLVARCEPDYPPALAALPDAPPVLALKGGAHLLARPAIAIVGARNASAAGVRLARELGAALGHKGLTVVSGLARGIDGAAHAGALETGTCAVVAGGIDVTYPPEHQELQNRIAAEGLLIAEMPIGTRPQARHFPRRNRLISGVSFGVVVVEAALRSGSLITARFALEQGREVFAVPGSPLDPRARGTNDLIRQGAVLTESADDVMTALDGMLRSPLAEPGDILYPSAPPGHADDAELQRHRGPVREKLSPVPIEVDELIRQCNLMPPIVLTILLELELAGLLARHPGNKVSAI
jgi:DNA processing protein